MNLEKLFSIQAKLDERIVKEHGLEGQDLLDKKILSLQVELGELANEHRGFKFWSKDQEPRMIEHKFSRNVDSLGNIEPLRNPLLEEYVDCLHFILSIGLENKYDTTDYHRLRKSDEEIGGLTYKDENTTKQFNNVFHFISEYENMRSFDDFTNILFSFLGLGEMLGFTTDQIEQAYLSKNQINHARQDSNY